VVADAERVRHDRERRIHRVLCSSALLDERAGGSWSPGLVSPIDRTRVNFLFTDHLGLTRDPGFTDNLLFLLLEAPRRHAGGG
jgi:hypothetical protein